MGCTNLGFQLVILTTLLLVIGEAIPSWKLTINNHRRRERKFERLAETVASTFCNKSLVVSEWFNQKLDHFNANDNTTYQQHYMVNWEFYNESNPSPVVFLQIGGEGPISKQWVCFHNYTYMQLAQESGAIVVQLEHRFFGANKDLPDLSTKNLYLLTTEQALEDLASFIRAFGELKNITKPTRWVAFGGSYPGSLAAWLRVKYPDLTIGNVASSAPLWPKLNFWEYSNVMEYALNDTNELCYKQVQLAFQELRKQTLSQDGRANLTKLFTLKPALSDNILDITNFMGFVFGTFQGIIQYTYDARVNKTLMDLNVGQVCRLMNLTQISLVNRLASVVMFDAKLENQYDGSFDITYDSMIKQLREVSLNGDAADSRGWIWLACNEFGWLQTTDKGNSIFGDIVSLGSQLKFCQDIFDDPMNTDYIQRQIAKAEKNFGTYWTFNATNVMLPNGLYDPWSSLGANTTISEQHQITIFTPGAAHCSDMYPAYDSEPAGLSATRELVKSEVRYYLNSTTIQTAASTKTVTSLVNSLFILVVCLFITKTLH